MNACFLIFVINLTLFFPSATSPGQVSDRQNSETYTVNIQLKAVDDSIKVYSVTSDGVSASKALSQLNSLTERYGLPNTLPSDDQAITSRWLDLLIVLDRNVVTLAAGHKPPTSHVMVPDSPTGSPSPYPPDADPASVKDQKLRAAYEIAIEKNKANYDRSMRYVSLIRLRNQVNGGFITWIGKYPRGQEQVSWIMEQVNNRHASEERKAQVLEALAPALKDAKK